MKLKTVSKNAFLSQILKKAVLLKASQAGKYLTRYHKLRLLQNAGIIKKITQSRTNHH